MRDPELRHPLIISLRTHELIRLASRNGITSTAEPVDGGMLRIWVSDDVKERLESHRFPGESDDDLVYRVVALANQKASGGPN